MTRFKINHYSSFSNLKSSIVELVNRTLKNITWREFSFLESYECLNILPEIVLKYNNKKDSTIGMNTSKVTKELEPLLLSSVYSNLKTIVQKKNKLKKCDYVRKSK